MRISLRIILPTPDLLCARVNLPQFALVESPQVINVVLSTKLNPKTFLDTSLKSCRRSAQEVIYWLVILVIQ